MSNDEKPETQIISSPKVNDQFGHLQVASTKQSKKKTYIGLSILAFGFLPLMCSSRTTSYGERITGIDVPTAIEAVTFDIPKYNYELDIFGLGKKTKKKKKVIVHFSGLELVKRPLFEQIPPGSMIKAKLLSGASDGLVKAIATEELNLGGGSIPVDTIFVGVGSSEESRLQVRFRSMVLPDRTIQKVRAVAADFSDKIVGLKGSTLGHYGLKLAASAGLHFASGLSQGLKEKQVIEGVAVDKANLENAAFNGASQATLELAKETMSEAKGQKRTFIIPEQTPIYIFFSTQ